MFSPLLRALGSLHVGSLRDEVPSHPVHLMVDLEVQKTRGHKYQKAPSKIPILRVLYRGLGNYSTLNLCSAGVQVLGPQLSGKIRVARRVGTTFADTSMPLAAEFGVPGIRLECESTNRDHQCSA